MLSTLADQVNQVSHYKIDIIHLGQSLFHQCSFSINFDIALQLDPTSIEAEPTCKYHKT